MSARPRTIGRFQVERILGQGGMGSVFLARDPAIDRLVAIKLMRSGLDPEQMRERFEKEARAVGRLHHQNIVTIFEYGFDEDGEPFLVMQYVEGLTLDRHIALPDVGLADRLTLMEGLSSGLHYAHRSGIIHRDIKPANLMVDSEGVLKILDFGIARATASATTQGGQIIGTINYMSPEQLFGKPIDHRTDIFSTGVVFYELLAGQLAFPGDISTGVLHRVLHGEPEPLSRRCPGLTAEIIAIVERCLRKDPEDRYPDMGVMRKELAAAKRRLETEPVQPVRPPMKPGDAPTAPTPGPGTSSQIDALREEKIRKLLADARRAMDRQEYTAALDACQEVLIIQKANTTALELRRQIEAARHAIKLVDEARGEFERGRLTSVDQLLDRALALCPNLNPAIDLRHAVDAHRRHQQEADAARVSALLDDAHRHLAADRLDLAGVAASEALAMAPGDERAAALKRDVEARVAARISADDEERRARAAIAKAAPLRGADARPVEAPRHDVPDRRPPPPPTAVDRRPERPGSPVRVSSRWIAVIAAGIGVVVLAIWLVPRGRQAGEGGAGASPTTTPGPVNSPLPTATSTITPVPTVAPTAQPTASPAGGAQPPPRRTPAPAQTLAPSPTIALSTTVPPTPSPTRAPGPPTPAGPSPSDRIAAGQRLFNEENFVQAAAEFTLALQADPANVAARDGKAKAEASLGRQVSGILQRAQEAFSNSLSYCEFENVRRLVDRVLALQSQNADARALKLRVEANQRRIADNLSAQGKPVPRCDGGGDRR
jgi:predicted Ser/Thr protein kinase